MRSVFHFTNQSIWDHSKLLLLLFVCFFTFFWETVIFSIGYWWDSSTYGHGLLVLPLSIYLVWVKRSKLLSVQRPSDFLGLGTFILFSMGWWLGYAVDVEIIKQLAFFGMIGAIFWSILGWRTTSVYMVPLILPLLALPIWVPLVPLLQYLTTQVVSFALSLISVPVYVQGHFIQIPEGKFSIEDVCAGLRYLLAALVVALVYVYLYMQRTRYQLIFIGSVILLSLSVNWIRVFAVILAGHLTNMSHFLVKDHADFGWWLFAFTLIPIFWFGNYLARKEQNEKKPLEDSKVGNYSHNAEVDDTSIKYIFPTLLIFIVVIPLSGFYLKAQTRHVLNSTRLDMQAPKSVGQWAGPYDVKKGYVQPKYQGADAETMADYRKGNSEVTLYVAKYFYQEQGKELIGEYNHPYNKSVWQPEFSSKQQVKLDDGNAIEIQEMLLKNEFGKRRLLWYWYSVDGVNTVTPVKAKFLQIKSFLSRSNSGSTIVLLTLNADSDVELLRNVLADYMTSMYSTIYAVINDKS